MKFLEIGTLAQLSSFFSGVESLSGESTINGRIEAYSCKIAGSDKKLYKSLEQQYQVELSKSPDPDLTGTSPFGPLSDSGSRKTLISLISILNASFPDYDFCNVKPEQFLKEIGAHMVINSVNTMLAGVVPNYNIDIGPKLWNAVDTEICIKECDIYSYIPDYHSDPYVEEEGNIWSFNYFFYNKRLRRIVYISFHAVSKMTEVSFTSEHSTSDEPTHLSQPEGWEYEEMDI